MAKNQPLLQSLFRGDYAEVLARAGDGSTGKLGRDRVAAVTGALAFLGRRREAEVLLRRHGRSLPSAEIDLCRFFLAINCFRYGEYDLGRAHLGRLSGSRGAANSTRSFLAVQAQGFLHYVTGEYDLAAVRAEEALSQAFRLGRPYFRALSSDLAGHALVHCGQTTRGLRLLAEARESALQLGNGGLAFAIGASILIYSNRYQPSAAVMVDLERLCDVRPAPDDYTLASALLELSSQYRLRGDLDAARSRIDQAAAIVLGFGNRRYQVQVLLGMADLARCADRAIEALSLCNAAESLSDPTTERVATLEAALLRLEIGSAREEPRLLELLRGAMHARSLRRARRLFPKKGFRAIAIPGEDQVMDLVEALETDPGEVHAATLDLRSFLHEQLGVPRGAQAIVSGLAGGRLAVFDRGNVVVTEAVSPLMRRLLRILSGPEFRSQSAIASAIWDRRVFHPLRHGPALHQLLARLRRLLGARRHWLEMSEAGYRLAVPFREEDGRLTAKLPTRLTLVASPASDVTEGAPSLNARQLEFLEQYRGAKAFGAQDYASRTAVAEATARRDLAGLVSLGYLQRLGRARATRYRIAGERP